MGRKIRNIPPRPQSVLTPRRLKPRNQPPQTLNKLPQERQAEAGFGYPISSIERPMPVEYLQPYWLDLVMLQRASTEQLALMRAKEFRAQQELRKRASMQRFFMKQIQIPEEQQTKKEEEKKHAEESTVDYSRLTSFLEKDDSFLTPWSWKPKEKQQQPRRADPYLSFNARERWAPAKQQDNETDCN